MYHTTKRASTVDGRHQATERWPRWLGAALALLLALAFSSIPTAHATSITVNNTTCTLVDAITAANNDTATNGCTAGSGVDTINLPVSSTITLTTMNNNIGNGNNGLPVIRSEITINGNGSMIARSTVALPFRVFQVAMAGNLTLNDTIVTDGSLPSHIDGAGIFSSGILTLSNSTISGNSTESGYGSGISNFGTMTISNSTISDNHTTINGGGAGIDTNGTLILINSTISGNSTTGTGGGITIGGGALTVGNSTISGNSAGGDGGGITNDGGTLTVSNSTISGNSASGSGGGIANITGTATFTSTLVAGNTGSTGQELARSGGTVTAASFNLFGHSGLTNAQAFSGFSPSGTDISATSNSSDPEPLSSILNTTLQNNGGPTATLALVGCSPAINAAPSGPAADQRGVSRPQGAADDIGAFELVPPVPCDHYADAVAASTSPLVLNPANAVGAPDGASATVVSLLSGGLVLDMGAREEGTGNLTVYYNGLSVQVNSTVDFLNASGTVISSGSLAMLDISAGTHSAVVIYSSAPTPYRFVKLRAVLLSVYRVDAVEAASIVP